MTHLKSKALDLNILTLYMTTPGSYRDLGPQMHGTVATSVEMHMTASETRACGLQGPEFHIGVGVFTNSIPLWPLCSEAPILGFGSWAFMACRMPQLARKSMIKELGQVWP